MRTRQLVLWTALCASLAAQESVSGFNWAGLQAGSLSTDPQTNLKASSFFGVQGGLLFEQRRYGLSFQALITRPKSDLAPGKSLSQSEFSATLMTGLSGDAASRFWPYLGVGLGGISVPKISSTTSLQETVKAGAAHASLGFLHRPAFGLVWGMEARYLFAFASTDLKEIHGSVMVGFSWGAKGSTRRPASEPPKSEPKALPPAVPLPVVNTAPLPPPVVTPVPAPSVPPPVIARPMVAPPANTTAPAPTPAPAPPPVPVPAPVLPAPVLPAPPVSRPAPVVARPDTGGSEVNKRLEALRQGDMAKALELGRKHIAAIPAQRWTIRLEIANLPSTLKNAVGAFPGKEPDLFIAPIKLKGGKTAYQLFLGDYASKADAERAAKAVPGFFLEGGQRPKPYLVSAIPNQ